MKNNPNIVVKRADKANIFVILDKKDYEDKINDIIGDETKFKHLPANPVKDLKIDANKLISAANKSCKAQVLKPIVGEFKPGYLYGKVKTHK